MKLQINVAIRQEDKLHIFEDIKTLSCVCFLSPSVPV